MKRWQCLEPGYPIHNGTFWFYWFFMLYGLSLFSVTLPANPEKSPLKNLPKSVSLLALTEKRNRVVTGEDTNSGNWVVAEDSYFWEQQCNEHPRYSKTLENTANKKANKLNDNRGTTGTCMLGLCLIVAEVNHKLSWRAAPLGPPSRGTFVAAKTGNTIFTYSTCIMELIWPWCPRQRQKAGGSGNTITSNRENKVHK